MSLWRRDKLASSPDAVKPRANISDFFGLILVSRWLALIAKILVTSPIDLEIATTTLPTTPKGYQV